MNEEDTLVV